MTVEQIPPLLIIFSFSLSSTSFFKLPSLFSALASLLSHLFYLKVFTPHLSSCASTPTSRINMFHRLQLLALVGASLALLNSQEASAINLPWQPRQLNVGGTGAVSIVLGGASSVANSGASVVSSVLNSSPSGVGSGSGGAAGSGTGALSSAANNGAGALSSAVNGGASQVSSALNSNPSTAPSTGSSGSGSNSNNGGGGGLGAVASVVNSVVPGGQGVNSIVDALPGASLVSR